MGLCEGLQYTQTFTSEDGEKIGIRQFALNFGSEKLVEMYPPSGMLLDSSNIKIRGNDICVVVKRFQSVPLQDKQIVILLHTGCFADATSAYLPLSAPGLEKVVTVGDELCLCSPQEPIKGTPLNQHCVLTVCGIDGGAVMCEVTAPGVLADSVALFPLHKRAIAIGDPCLTVCGIDEDAEVTAAAELTDIRADPIFDPIYEDAELTDLDKRADAAIDDPCSICRQAWNRLW